jgi:hypothetical protein
MVDLAHAANVERGGVRYISGPPDYPLTFSVCSLVADEARFDRLVGSFRKCGFTAANTEFIAADNRYGNTYDGYEWTRRLYPECRGQYVIFCHDDIELLEDGYDKLVARLDALTLLDPAWVLAGNAGGRFRAAKMVDGKPTRPYAMTVTDKFGSFRMKETFVRAESLDENFFVMRHDRFVGTSFDLTGYHFYASDMCLMGEMLGGSAYVIDFHLRHHGQAAASRAFYKGRAQFREKYARYFPGRVLAPVTGPFELNAGQ